MKVIYALVDEDEVTRYVGQSKDPVRRLEFHISQTFRKKRDDRDPVQHWIYDQLIEKRHVPKIDILEFCDDTAVYAVERKWIEHFGYGQLKNVSPKVRQAKTWQVRHERMLGVKLSDETKKKMSESAKRGWEKRRAAAAR